MYNTAGAPIGTAQIWQDKSGLVYVDIASISLPAGTHGIHFHAVGKCDTGTTPAFSSAGGHYNPMGKQHGLQNPAGPTPETIRTSSFLPAALAESLSAPTVFRSPPGRRRYSMLTELRS